MRIAARYRFCKSDEFYYLCRDRSSLAYDEHATAMSSALRNLSGSSIAYSPVSIARSEISNDKSPAVSAQNSKDEPSVNDGKTGDNIDTSSVPEDKVSPRDVRVIGMMEDLMTKDIQIHVQRPSPVREVTPKTFVPNQSITPDSYSRPSVNSDDPKVGTTSPQTVATEEPVSQLTFSPGNNIPVADAEAAVMSADPKYSAGSGDPSAAKTDENHRSGVELPPVMELGSSPENAGLTQEVNGCKMKEVELNRVRPISGPATVNFSVSSEFDAVRKSHSVTDSLDDAPRGSFHQRSAAQNQLKRGNLTYRSQDSTSTVSEARAQSSIKRIHSTVSFDGPCATRLGDSDLSASGTVSDSSRVQSRQPSGSNADPQLFSELRLRHASGIDTPVSYMDTTSVASTGEAGTFTVSCQCLLVVDCCSICGHHLLFCLVHIHYMSVPENRMFILDRQIH